MNNKKVPYERATELRHKDIFTVGDRSFRWEYPVGSRYLTSAPTPPAKSVASPKKGKVLTPSKKLANSANRKSSDYKVLTPKGKPPTPKTPKGSSGEMWGT